MASQLILPHLLDANGDPVAGGKAYVFETGTTTPVTVYTDTGLSVAHANPIVADSAGRFAQAFYGGSTALKVVLTTSADATVDTLDPVAVVPVTSTSAASVSFSPITDNPATNVQTAIANENARIDGILAGTGFPADSIPDAAIANPSGLVFIASQDASASATLDFTGFDASKYDAYTFIFSNLIPATDNDSLAIRTSSNGGSSYDSGASDYNAIRMGYDGNGNAVSNVRSGDDAIYTGITVVGSGVANDAGGISGEFTVYGPHLSARTRLAGVAFWDDANSSYSTASFRGQRLSTSPVNALRLLFVGGNITSGTVTMWGLRNS